MYRVVIVSPHLDDAILSFGASIDAASRAGARVGILTVLAGDPTSREAAGEWDAAAGFRLAGEASASRRAEDARACAIVGADPVWLPFGDNQYSRGGGDDEIRSQVANLVCWADLALIPGFPLLHDDHRWLADLLEGDIGARVVAEYVEQPYAAVARLPATQDDGWEVASLPYISIGTKHRAARAYETQIPLLPAASLSAIRLAEARSGGEAIRLRSGSRDDFDSVVGSLWPVRASLVHRLAGHVPA